MDKPLPLLIADTKKALAEALNNSKLPPCILAPIAKEIYEATLQAQQAELAQAQKALEEGDDKT